jgi:hypothetical protein
MLWLFEVLLRVEYWNHDRLATALTRDDNAVRPGAALARGCVGSSMPPRAAAPR